MDNKKELDKQINDIVGESFEELSLSDMMLIQGSGEGVEPQATPSPISASSIPCAKAVSAVISVLFTVKAC